MTRSLLFWILMLLWLVMGLLGTNWQTLKTDWRSSGGGVLLFLLVLVLGWQVFGSPVK